MLQRPSASAARQSIYTGFASFLTDLAWITSDVPFTIGQAVDVCHPVLFLHVFPAYPSGRMRSHSERG